MYDCEAAVLLNVYIYLVFVGEGWLALLPSHLPHLRRLDLMGCDSVCHKYVEELVAAVPELEVFPGIPAAKWYIEGAMRNNPGNYL